MSALPEQNPRSWHQPAFPDCMCRAPLRLCKHGPKRPPKPEMPPNPERRHRHGPVHAGGNGGQGQLSTSQGHLAHVSGGAPFAPPGRAQAGAQGRPLILSQVAPSSGAVSHLLSLPLSAPQRASWVTRRTGRPPPQSGVEDAPCAMGRTGGQHLAAGGAASPCAGPG